MVYWKDRTAGPINAIHPATGKTIEVNPGKDARISMDLDAELRRLPALVSWWMSLRDRAEMHYREARYAEHNAEEDLYEMFRMKPAEKGERKLTEVALKMAVKKHPTMRKAFRHRMDAQAMHQQLASAVKAIEEKRWSLMDS